MPQGVEEGTARRFGQVQVQQARTGPDVSGFGVEEPTRNAPRRQRLPGRKELSQRREPPQIGAGEGYCPEKPRLLGPPGEFTPIQSGAQQQQVVDRQEMAIEEVVPAQVDEGLSLIHI